MRPWYWCQSQTKEAETRWDGAEGYLVRGLLVTTCHFLSPVLLMGMWHN